MIKHLRTGLIAALAFAVVACGIGPPASIPASPSEVADRVKIDEQTGIAITTAYTAVAKAAALAIETGLIRDPATIKRIGELDVAAYDAVKAVRSAYDAANSRSYLEGLTKANAAVKAFYNAVTTARRTSEQSTAPPAVYEAVLYGEVTRQLTVNSASLDWS